MSPYLGLDILQNTGLALKLALCFENASHKKEGFVLRIYLKIIKTSF
jgi:hypothetical protein